MDPVSDELTDAVADREKPSCEGFGELGVHLTCILIDEALLQINVLELDGCGPELVEELCDYVNEHWAEPANAIHLASYVMWRLNWIHPFADGNGRTSRITSYVVLSIRAGYVLPGTPTIPDQIVDNRTPYFDALDAAYIAYSEGRIDVSKMEELIGGLLAKQLTTFYAAAGGSETAN